MINDYSTPERDATLGLIFRLNDLWWTVERKVSGGDYEGWEITLDRIYSNLLYRNEVEIEEIEDEEGNKKIIDVKISNQDTQEWKIMKRKIKEAKKKMRVSLFKQDRIGFSNAKEEFYNALLSYDIWCRKFMQRHQLYLKETESNPSKALFGGAFKRR